MNNRILLLPVLFLTAVALTSCDRAPLIRSDITWNSREVDQDCVRKAIEGTSGVTFDKQSDRCAGSELGLDPVACEERIYESDYVVTANKKAKYAFVAFNERANDLRFVRNQSVGGLGKELTDEDAQGFRVAIRAVNESLKKFCPHVVSFTDPK